MIQIAVCDDDLIQLKNTGEAIAQAAACYVPEIDLFSSSKEFLNAVEKSGYRPDVAILDIVLPDDSGISLAKKLNGLCPQCAVIFLTAFLDYATDVYETKHSYFIVKSQLKERIAPAIAKALEDISRDLHLVFRDNGTLQTLPLREILYLERNLKKTIIVHISGKQYFTTAKPEQLIKDLRNCPFVKCHQSYHVNLELVTGMTKNSFLMKNGQEVPISRSQRKTAKEAFFAVISNPIAVQQL